jgi:acetoin utilization protein AcuB
MEPDAATRARTDRSQPHGAAASLARSASTIARALATHRNHAGRMNANPTQPTVAEFMTPDPIGADAGLALVDANERMYLHGIRHLVVHNGSEVSGVLSTRDVAIALSLAADPDKLTLRDAMAADPYTCTPETPLVDVVLEMEKHRFGSAIVVRGDELVGIFTTTDALRAVRALVTGKPAQPAAAPVERDEGDHAARAARRVRLGRLRQIDGTWFLGHRLA